MALIYGFSEIDYTADGTYELSNSTTTYSVEITAEGDGFMELEVTNSSQSAIYYFDDTGLDITEGSSTVSYSYGGFLSGNGNEGVAVAMLSANHHKNFPLQDKTFEEPTGGMPDGWWVCHHLTRNTTDPSCTLDDAEIRSHCGGGYSVGGTSTSCIWDNFGCITLTEIYCN